MPHALRLRGSMPFRGFALENVAGSTIGADGFRAMDEIQKYAGMHIPCGDAGRGAMQGQVTRGDFNHFFVRHDEYLP